MIAAVNASDDPDPRRAGGKIVGAMSAAALAVPEPEAEQCHCEQRMLVVERGIADAGEHAHEPPG